MTTTDPAATRSDGSRVPTRLVVLDFHGVCFDPSQGAIDPAAAELVDEAQRHGVVVTVLSNELDDATIASTPLLERVDRVVVCATGIQKPDRRAFQRAMLLAGVESDRTVVVDDGEINVRGARAAGATAIAFDLDDRTASWRAVRQALGLAAN